jgi:hypothetical protein
MEQRRRPHNELKSAMREFLAARKGDPASIAQIRAGCEAMVGIAPDSSYRSALQDERYFERISRGVFKLRAEG